MNFKSILKPVGQNNMIICRLGHRNDFDQSNESRSTDDMTPPRYAVTLYGTIRSQLRSIERRECMSNWALEYYEKYKDFEKYDYASEKILDKRPNIQFLRAVQYSLVEENLEKK
jgi:hypothetical protein